MPYVSMTECVLIPVPSTSLALEWNPLRFSAKKCEANFTTMSTTSSINDILPQDVLQYILSFIDVHQNTKVCHKWNLLSYKNEMIYTRQIYKKFAISSNQHNNCQRRTYIIHPNRHRLNKYETDAGFNSIYNDLSSALDIIKSGDQILIHKEIDASITLIQSAAFKICIIGIESDVIISGSININNSSISFQNISFIRPTIFSMIPDSEFVKITIYLCFWMSS